MQPQATKEGDASMPLLLHVRLPNGDVVSMDIIQNDIISEPLNELKETYECCHYTNAHLQFKDTILNESQPFCKYSLKSNDTIDLVLGPYSSELSLAHIKTMSKILANPFSSLKIPISLKNLDFANPVKILEDDTQKQYEKEQKMNEEEKKIEKEKIEKEEIEKYKKWIEEKIKKIDEFKGAISLDKLAEEFKISDIEKTPYIIDHSQYKCVDSIEYTSFNPPTNQRSMQGDLHYIKMRTLEGKTMYITASVYGFFVNCSNASSLFPQPLIENGKPLYSQTLLGILFVTSEKFRQIWSDIKKFIDAASFNPNFQKRIYIPWASHNESQTPTIKCVESSLIGTTYCQKALVSYNEEFQICKDFPTTTSEQRIWRDKIFYKIYSEFVDMASKNAVSIIDQCIPPINPHDSTDCHIYVINNILYSFLKDDMTSFEISNKEDDSPYTYLQAKHALSVWNIVHALDISDVHIIPSTIISYKGQKILAQAMILNLSNTLYHPTQNFIDFGSTDDGETYKDNEALLKSFTQIADKLNMEKDIALDKENKEHLLPGPYDIKGLRGIDNRNYILDCNRIYPRDLNFADDKYSGCLLRAELISQYIQHQSIIYSTKKYEEAKKMQKDTPLSEEDRKKQDDMITAKLEKDMKEFEEIIEKKYRYNVNIHTKAHIKKSKEEFDQSEQKLKEFAQFMKEIVIPKMVESIFLMEIPPIDSESLTNTLHMHGINVRYLGEIIKFCIKIKADHYLIELSERECIIRSAKHIINKYIRSTSPLYLSEIIVYLLNLLITSAPTQKLMNEGKIEFNNTFEFDTFKNVEETKLQSDLESVKPDGKKSKKAKKDFQSTNKFEEDQKIISNIILKETKFSKPELPKALKLKPKDLWAEIKALCSLRYFHDLPDEQSECFLYKKKGLILPLLRDLCRTLGVVLDSHSSIKFDEPKVMHYSNLPLRRESLIGCEPRVKKIDLGNKEERNLMEEAKKYATNDKASGIRFELYHLSLIHI